MSLLDSRAAKEIFDQTLERVRIWYGCSIAGYVVMPEHVHLLLSEPERSRLSVTIQMLKQITSQKLRVKHLPRFWQVRYYDFPVWSEAKRMEKLRYIHRNPVRRGLVARPGLEMEQFCSLCDGDGRDCRDRIAMDGAEARTDGCRAPSQSPPSRKKRGKGGATP